MLREVQTDLDPLNRQADRCFAPRVPDSAGNGRLLAHFDAARKRRSAGAKSRFSLLSDETRSPSTRRKPRARADFGRVTQ